MIISSVALTKKTGTGMAEARRVFYAIGLAADFSTQQDKDDPHFQECFPSYEEEQGK